MHSLPSPAATNLHRFQSPDAADETAYLSFLNVPVLAGCVGAWGLMLLVGAGVLALF